MMRKSLFIMFIFIFNKQILAQSIDVCFTPGECCENKIINAINSAHKQILIQAYGFTNRKIMSAVIDAERNGVDVEVLLDKSQTKGKHPSYYLLKKNNINAFIDYKPAIAHNKVMIIDNGTVITGSYNFTNGAEHRNAENVLIIHDKEIAKQYKNNWLNREEKSK